MKLPKALRPLMVTHESLRGVFLSVKQSINQSINQSVLFDQFNQFQFQQNSRSRFNHNYTKYSNVTRYALHWANELLRLKLTEEGNTRGKDTSLNNTLQIHQILYAKHSTNQGICIIFMVHYIIHTKAYCIALYYHYSTLQLSDCSNWKHLTSTFCT